MVVRFGVKGSTVLWEIERSWKAHLEAMIEGEGLPWVRRVCVKELLSFQCHRNTKI